MKFSRIGRLLATVSTTLILLLVSSVPAGAADSDTPKVWPSPITDPAKAVPFSHPELNTCDPKSPLYSPNAKYGRPGTRFGPPGQKSNSIPTVDGEKAGDGITETGHRWFGSATNFSDYSYTYAYLGYVSGLSMPSGTSLYAPTMLGANYSPLEVLTRYWWDSSTLKRHVAVYDHVYGSFNVSFAPTADYLDVDNTYRAEIVLSDGWWYAYIYNFDTQEWETLYSREGGTGPEPYGRGWLIWEEWDFDENNWPDISANIRATNFTIGTEGVGATYVTSSYGFETSDKGSAPYDFCWVYNYYQWFVNMDY